MKMYSPKDRKDMAKGYAKGRNERYMKKGMGPKVMKNHGNTYPIETTDAEYYDMNRMKNKPMNRQGYCKQAFDYKY